MNPEREIRMRPHHFAKEGMYRRLSGHGRIHARRVRQILYSLEELPEDTPVLFVFDQTDPICIVCPRNIEYDPQISLKQYMTVEAIKGKVTPCFRTLVKNYDEITLAALEVAFGKGASEFILHDLINENIWQDPMIRTIVEDGLLSPQLPKDPSDYF